MDQKKKAMETALVVSPRTIWAAGIPPKSKIAELQCWIGEADPNRR